MIMYLFLIPQWIRLTISIIYLGIIVFLSLLPSNDFPDVSLFEGADKIIHTCMYLGLTCLACWSSHSESNRLWYFLILLFSISWGIIMEIFQLTMHEGRSFDVYDIIGNSIGTLVGLTIYFLISRRVSNSQKVPNKITF